MGLAHRTFLNATPALGLVCFITPTGVLSPPYDAHARGQPGRLESEGRRDTSFWRLGSRDLVASSA